VEIAGRHGGKPLAFSRNSPSEQEYEALHDAVAESTHGRWFLQEYARRHRAADTRILLDAIQKLERFLSSDESEETPPRLYAQLLDMTKAIAEARTDIEASATAFTSSSDDQNRAHRLAALVADLESRLAFLLRAASSVSETLARENGEPEGQELIFEMTPAADQPEQIERAEELRKAEAAEPQLTPLPFAAGRVESESESFELELEPLRVAPLNLQEGSERAEQARLGSPETPTALGHAGTDIMADPMPNEPLLLRDYSGRTNLPAPASLYRFAMLFGKAGVVLGPAGEESESERLTLEPLPVRKFGADVQEQEQTQPAVHKAERELPEEKAESAEKEIETLSSAWMFQIRSLWMKCWRAGKSAASSRTLSLAEIQNN
jgi:hypothetical protein